MTRTWCSTHYLLAVCLAASCAAPAGILAATTLPTDGEIVDTDVPAIYRLPLVPLVSSSHIPSTEDRLAQRNSIDPAPAGDPPDESSLDERPHTRAVEPPTESTVQLQSSVLSYTPTTAGLTAQLLPAVQRGYALAQRGALFAARTEFVQVLRRVAQAQDAAAHGDARSRALAAGLRALDEAEDFVPDGIQLEAELDVRAVASSHRTPVLHERAGDVLPHETIALYHSFAQQRLAQVAAGDQAGSMALYGLGKIYAHLAEHRDDDVQFVRCATTMHAAALDARPDNHLAANEFGVLMCRTGRPAEAAWLFERTIDHAPSANAYHNLAVAQQNLGLHGLANANEQESQRLAAQERAGGAVSRRAGIEWVSPDEMARVAQVAPLAPTPTGATLPPAAPAKSAWQRTIALTKALPRPGSGPTNDSSGSVGNARIAAPIIQQNPTHSR